MTLPLEEIEAKARAATPGPWVRPTMGGLQVLTGDSWSAVCVFHWKALSSISPDIRSAAWEDGRGPSDPEANAAYIALMNPQTALALVARVRELEGLKRTCEDMLADFMTSEAHHPDHVLISAKTFEAIQAVLTINGDAPR